MDIRRQVGLNLKRLRKRKGWSQEDLALEADFHRTYVSGIERGERNPTVIVIERLARTLGVKPGTLLDAPKAGSAH
jgi:transcriptional regulator with XRE-family HTH domain